MDRWIFALAALALSACTPTHDPNAVPPADAAVDAADVPTDAPAPPPPGQELTTGGGRLTSATYTLEVQLGHGLDQRPSQSTTYHVEANTVIKP